MQTSTASCSLDYWILNGVHTFWRVPLQFWIIFLSSEWTIILLWLFLMWLTLTEFTDYSETGFSTSVLITTGVCVCVCSLILENEWINVWLINPWESDQLGNRSKIWEMWWRYKMKQILSPVLISDHKSYRNTSRILQDGRSILGLSGQSEISLTPRQHSYQGLPNITAIRLFNP